ncbi:MAG: hypothetical protein ABIE43_02620 [Patescibacteria group bacterium]
MGLAKMFLKALISTSIKQAAGVGSPKNAKEFGELVAAKIIAKETLTQLEGDNKK